MSTQPIDMSDLGSIDRLLQLKETEQRLMAEKEKAQQDKPELGDHRQYRGREVVITGIEDETNEYQVRYADTMHPLFMVSGTELLQAVKPAELPKQTELPKQSTAQGAPTTPFTPADSEFVKLVPNFEDIARAAVGRGEPHVVPIVIGGKNPAVAWKNNPDYNIDEYSTPQMNEISDKWIKGLLGRGFKKFNAAVIAREDNVCFLDDDKHTEFVAAYKEWSGEKFPSTYATSARENRWQLHFYQTDKTRELGNVVQTQIDGLDFSFRQRNEYVVAEGSVYKDGINVYRRVDDSPVVPMPDKLVEFIAYLADKGGRSKAATIKAASNENGNQGLIPQGLIHDALFNQAKRLRDLGLSHAGIKAELLDWAHKRCEPPAAGREDAWTAKIEQVALSVDVVVPPIIGGVSVGTPASTPPEPTPPPTPTAEEILAAAPDTKPEDAQVAAELMAKDPTVTVEQATEMASNVKPPSPDAKKLLEEWLDNPEAKLDNKQVIELIGLLDTLDYDPLRDKIAAKSGLRKPTLDAERNKRQAKTAEEDEASNIGSFIQTRELWKEPVNIADVLDECEAVFTKYIHFKRAEDYGVVALWVAQTYTVNEQREFPYLGFRSPTFGCGKSTCLELVGDMANRSLMAANLTAAAAFRVVDQFQPTLIIDELDTFIDMQPEFIGILNNGHKKKGGQIIRMTGEHHDVATGFSVWGPKAYGMIGNPPSTFASRTIPVLLEVAVPRDNLTPLPKVEQDIILLENHLHSIGRKFARWVQDNTEAIKNFRPKMKNLINRGRDNWYPLLRIAEMAGTRWTEKAIKAAGMDDPYSKPDDQRLLLIDIRDIFYTRGVEEIEPLTLLSDLLQQSRWVEMGKYEKPMTKDRLSSMLGSFGVRSRHTKRKGETVRLYLEKDLKEVFDRYCADTPPETVELSPGGPRGDQAAEDEDSEEGAQATPDPAQAEIRRQADLVFGKVSSNCIGAAGGGEATSEAGGEAGSEEW